MSLATFTALPETPLGDFIRNLSDEHLACDRYVIGKAIDRTPDGSPELPLFQLIYARLVNEQTRRRAGVTP